MATTIVTKKGSGAPTASDLVEGELAVDTTNGRLYTENSSAAVVELGSNPSGNITFGDNGKAIFGAGSDLQIYHDASDSIILDNGTGNLKIQANDLVLKNADGSKEYLKGTDGGSVRVRYNNTTVLETTATGIDVTGTVTASDMTLSDSTNPTLTITDTTTPTSLALTAGNLSTTIGTTTDHRLKFETNGTERLRIENNGDISFYEDTGTTAKLFWDASAEALGIGTSSPTRALSVFGDTAGVISITSNSTDGISSLSFGDTADDNAGRVNYLNASDEMLFYTATAERMRIDASGNVGIGTDSPDSGYKLDVAGNVVFGDGGGFDMNVDGSRWQFSLGGSEKMRLDASGNFLVGKPTTSFGTDGFQANADGQIWVTNASASVTAFNRRTTDGAISVFYKDGASVGSIGANSSRLTIGSGDTGLLIAGDLDNITPFNTSTNASRDAAIDLGNSGVRFKDLYRSGSTISTSDRNMKQDERDLTEAETRVAQACKGLLKAFRFIDAVQVDGDGACIHFGIIAQDLQAAFEAEGLDATNYAMFRPSTSTDENGNERTRLGVCYENLLAFIIAAI